MTDSLYSTLVKAPMSLALRNNFASFLAAQSRTRNPLIWSKILSSKELHKSSLLSLASSGFLSLDIPFKDTIVSELYALSPSQFFDKGYISDVEIFPLKGVSDLPSVRRLISDSSLYSLVSLYLGAPVCLFDCLAWWHFPMPLEHVSSNAQRWHRDRDDFGELKLFFYGTNVDKQSGPHAFIPGSHIETNLARIFRSASTSNPIVNGLSHKFLDDQDLSDLGLLSKDIVSYTGKPGTSFLEDTRGFHRAYTPTGNPRLIFSLVWTVGSGKILSF